MEGWGKKTSGSLCGEKNVLEKYLIIIKEAKYIWVGYELNGLRAFHGDAYTTFELIIIKSTSNSQKYIFGWLRSKLGGHFAFVYSVNRSLYSFSQTKRFLNSIWAEMSPPPDQDVHQYIEEIDR